MAFQFGFKIERGSPFFSFQFIPIEQQRNRDEYIQAKYTQMPD